MFINKICLNLFKHYLLRKYTFIANLCVLHIQLEYITYAAARSVPNQSNKCFLGCVQIPCLHRASVF